MFFIWGVLSLEWKYLNYDHTNAVGGWKKLIAVFMTCFTYICYFAPVLYLYLCIESLVRDIMKYDF